MATLETFNWLKTIPGESIAEGLTELVEGGSAQMATLETLNWLKTHPDKKYADSSGIS